MDRAGRDIKGTIDAINEEEVVEKVRSMGYFPTEIVDNIQSKSKEALFREEDQELLVAINASTLPPEGWGEKNYQSNSVKGWRE